ncbi:uncharacterized protein [Amphiura filiformis]|uniref:uncharacterized protein n=1 Tax=Amphiura filiformis TaxID=82378 RepID=UPI003B20FBC2
MASWTTGYYASLLSVFSVIIGSTYGSGINDWHFPTCVVADESDGICRNVFLRSSTSLPSARYGGDVVHHEWLRYLDHVYDYDDQDETDCRIRRRSINHKDFTNMTWTQDGFSTCLYEDVIQFNTWWTSVCTQEYCGLDTNCFRYATYLGYHLWNNCNWNIVLDRPDYDIKLP